MLEYKYVDILRLRKLTFVAVGWERYSEKNLYLQSYFYKYIFDKDNIHSVRDNLQREVIIIRYKKCYQHWLYNNVKLTDEFCKQIPTYKSTKVVLL